MKVERDTETPSFPCP